MTTWSNVLCVAAVLSGAVASQGGVGPETVLLDNATYPNYTIADETIHLVCLRGGKPVYARFALDGTQVGEPERIPGAVSRCEYEQSHAIAYRDGKVVAAYGAGGGDPGKLFVSIRTSAGWSEPKVVGTAPDKSGRWSQVINPEVVIRSDGGVHVVADRFGKPDKWMHYVLDAKGQVTQRHELGTTAERTPCRLFIDAEDRLRVGYLVNFGKIYLRRYADGAWSDRFHVGGRRFTNFDMAVRGDVSYFLHSQENANRARIDVVKGAKKVGSLTFKAEKCWVHSLAVNQATGSIHCSFYNRHTFTHGTQALKVISRYKGHEDWSKPTTITEANGAKSKARMISAGKATYIIYHDRRGKVILRAISEDAAADAARAEP
ncbi:MAG: hypothetical protein KGY99_08250 [Phycisphaerae bacterium]|nr:hypothetical protein [Phycisphaerae bacterium]